MKYKDGMSLLSQCGLGAILISEDYNIIDVNEIGTGSALWRIIPKLTS